MLPKKQSLRNNEYYDMQSEFDDLYDRSRRGQLFKSLMPLISSRENILLAYRNIKNNGGSITPGTDGLTIRDIETMPCNAFVQKVQNKLSWYQPKPVRRVNIPKADGKTRPLGIPCIWDRIVQQCVKQVLEPICEARFHDFSFGFRPNRSTENAIAKTQNFIQIQHLHYVVDVDIKGFFDNVNHTKLIKQLWNIGIQDKTLLCVIRAMLKAPIVLPDGSIENPTKGTPQGGILSPLLANVVLNELDWWVSSQWETHPAHKQLVRQYNRNGSENRGNFYRELRKSNLKEMFIVRYADDFKIFCKRRRDADKMFCATKMWLSERLKLEISPEKSKVTNLRRHSSCFLGFELKAVRKSEKYVVESHMCEKAIKAETEKLIDQVKNIEYPSDEYSGALAVTRYNSMVLGIHNYYGIATHIAEDCRRIQWRVSKCLFIRLNKRIKKTGEFNSASLRDRYGKSKQVRYVGGQELIPVGYVQHRNAYNKNLKVSSYTAEGRALIHKTVEMNTKTQQEMMRRILPDQSLQFVDNRNSKWFAQKGRCAVTGDYLRADQLCCHHIKPKGAPFFGTDDYDNLVIIHEDIHQLIHEVQSDTVAKYLTETNLNSAQLKKLNKYRIAAGLEPIS